MRQSLRFLAAIFSSLCLFFGSVAAVSADENFGVSLVSTYTVTQTGSTVVEQKFTLTNKKPTLFVKQYAVEFGSSKLRNVRVYDSKGAIKANVVSNDNKTSIGITFDDKIVGEGKTRTFSIQFENPDAAVVTGNVLEMYVPRLSNATEYDSYKVILKTPIRYGSPVRVTPKDYQTGGDTTHIILTFPNVGEQSISALFGQRQVFEFDLRYNLENPTTNIGLIQIALPPDTPRQKVVYSSLNPSPKDLTRDQDGNWIATYEIAAEKKLDVTLVGKAIISLEPQHNLPSVASVSLTNPQKYWETDSKEILQLTEKYKQPKEIYDFVTKTLSYNYNKVNGSVERLGAVGALTDPQNAACQEFTDLFVAMSRAAGIPARRVTGYAYTGNSRLRPLSLVEDILHAWPEYYDANKNEWIPVDPTWGNTTGGINYFDQFDFNHFTFAINGVSSTTPYGAGAYKRESEQTKDVHVEFGTDVTTPTLAVDVTAHRQKNIFAVLTNEYEVEIKNNTGAAWYDVPVKITSVDSRFNIEPSEQRLSYLLPFQTQVLHFKLGGRRQITPARLNLTVQVQDLSSKHDVVIGFSSQDFFITLFIGVSVGVSVGLLALIARGLLVPRRAR